MLQRVVNRAVVHGVLYRFTVFRSACNRQVDLDSEIIEACRSSFLIGRHAHKSPLAGESLFSQILRRVVPGTGPQRGHHQLQRRHGFVEAAVLFRLIARDRMLPRADFKLYLSEMFDCDFHASSSLSLETKEKKYGPEGFSGPITIFFQL